MKYFALFITETVENFRNKRRRKFTFI